MQSIVVGCVVVTKEDKRINFKKMH